VIWRLVKICTAASCEASIKVCLSVPNKAGFPFNETHTTYATTQQSSCRVATNFENLVYSGNFLNLENCQKTRRVIRELCATLWNKKFELLLTRRAKAYSRSGSLDENWFIYKYHIFYLDRITIVPWRSLVNDIDLFRSPKSPKSYKTPYFGVQGH